MWCVPDAVKVQADRGQRFQTCKKQNKLRNMHLLWHTLKLNHSQKLRKVRKKLKKAKDQLGTIPEFTGATIHRAASRAE